MTEAFSFLAGGGEMGERTRAYNWAASPLGTPDAWPQSLRAAVGILLHSRFPMLLLWGDALTVFYNDAYRPALNDLGQHPAALGRPAADCWADAWPTLKPVIDQLLAGGEATWTENLPLPGHRKGQSEMAYWTSSYSPAYTDNGQIGGVFVTCLETTNLVQTARQLTTNEALFRSLVDEAPVATCLFIGREMRIDVANQPMLAIWGKDKGVLGKPLHLAVPELAGQPFLQILDDVFTTGETYQASNARAELIVNGQLDTFYFDFTYKPLRNADGDVYAVMDMAIDVTEQVQTRRRLEKSEAQYRALSQSLEKQVQQRTHELDEANEELAIANEELLSANEDLIGANNDLNESNELLKRSNENLQQFAYVASHDLQEPLRKIQAFGDLLLRQFTDASPLATEHIGRMQSAASRMSTLIQDLLTFSRISAQGEADQVVQLNQVIDQVLDDLELLIADHRAVITVDVLPRLTGNPHQLGQLFQNLISNALKFHRPGQPPHVHIRASMLTNSQLPTNVKPIRQTRYYHRIDVIDQGIGFEQKYADQIFQVFQRLHSQSQYVGTGIGLAICEKVVTNHGGAIIASSQVGQGATFSIYLPVQS